MMLLSVLPRNNLTKKTNIVDYRLHPPCKAELKQAWLCSCFVRLLW